VNLVKIYIEILCSPSIEIFKKKIYINFADLSETFLDASGRSVWPRLDLSVHQHGLRVLSGVEGRRRILRRGPDGSGSVRRPTRPQLGLVAHFLRPAQHFRRKLKISEKHKLANNFNLRNGLDRAKDKLYFFPVHKILRI